MRWHDNAWVNSHQRWKQTRLVWIDQYSECNGMTSFMEFMLTPCHSIMAIVAYRNFKSSKPPSPLDNACVIISLMWYSVLKNCLKIDNYNVALRWYTVVNAMKDPLLWDRLVLCDRPLSAANSIFCTFCTTISDRTPTRDHPVTAEGAVFHRRDHCTLQFIKKYCNKLS